MVNIVLLDYHLPPDNIHLSIPGSNYILDSNCPSSSGNLSGVSTFISLNDYF